MRSTRTTSSAWSRTASGRVSWTRTPVISYTVSLRLSKCWTLTVEMTLMPAAWISSTLCQRLACCVPGTLVCASSSTSTHSGFRAITAAVSSSSNSLPRYASRLSGTCSRPSTSSAVSARPCVSTKPMTRSSPRAQRRCASASMLKVLPTPGA